MTFKRPSKPFCDSVILRPSLSLQYSPTQQFPLLSPEHSLVLQQSQVTHVIPNRALRGSFLGSLLSSHSAEAGKHSSCCAEHSRLPGDSSHTRHQELLLCLMRHSSSISGLGQGWESPCVAFSVAETLPECDPWDPLVVSTRDRVMQRAGGV